MKRPLSLSFVCLSLVFSVTLNAHSSRELQFENDRVKVWKTTITPRGALKMHRHDDDRVIVGLKGGTLERVEENGERSKLLFETNKAYWLSADPLGELHGDINVSPHAVEVMVIEFKTSP